MREPRYEEHAPPPALADWVHCVWTFVAEHDPAPQRIAPDGRPELIVHLRKPYLERQGKRDVHQPFVLFAGQLTKPLTLVAHGGVLVLGVRFHPYAARAFLGVDADAATDQRLDLAALHGDAPTKLRRVLEEESRDEWRFRHVLDYVESRVAKAGMDADVKAAVDALFVDGEIERPEHIAERQWQRRFKAEVGVSAQMLQSVVRFRRVFDAIERPETSGWVEAALAAGYFDQPQMSRDFRRFLGVTAREWAQQKAGLATALTASGSYKTGQDGGG